MTKNLFLYYLLLLNSYTKKNPNKPNESKKKNEWAKKYLDIFLLNEGTQNTQNVGR